MTCTTTDDLSDVAVALTIGGQARTMSIERTESNSTSRIARAAATTAFVEDHTVNVWLLTYTVDHGDNGDVAFTIFINDTAGNVATVDESHATATHHLYADTTPPTIVAATLRHK